MLIEGRMYPNETDIRVYLAAGRKRGTVTGAIEEYRVTRRYTS